MIFAYKKTLCSWRMASRFFSEFILVSGTLSIFLDILDFYQEFHLGWKGILAVLIIGMLFAIIRSLPRRSFTASFSHPDTKITIKIGNLFIEEAHIVVGFSDTFDTEIGDIVSGNSVQGQFLTAIFGNDRQRLDRELETVLAGETHEVDSTKVHGKNKRYQIGTTVALAGQNRKFFCSAYSRMGSDLVASSDQNYLWIALQNIWRKARAVGEQKPVAIPVIGTNLSRVDTGTFMLQIKIIMMSYLVNSRIGQISKELVVVISDQDMEKVNLLELQDFAKTLNN